MRISIIGDNISQMKPDMHPSEYLIPLIHQRGRNTSTNPFPEAHPTIEKEQGPQRDPFYSNTGILLYLHFLKNFPNVRGGSLRIRSRLLYNDNTIKDDQQNECIWV